MDVILLERIRGLGSLGETVNVKPGYARNYLVPSGKAVFATEANVVAFEARRAELETMENAKLEEAMARKAKLDVLNLTIAAKAQEEGKLFGSIGVKEVQQAIHEAGHAIEKQAVHLPAGTIRALGEYTVELNLHTDVVVELPLSVVAQS